MKPEEPALPSSENPTQDSEKSFYFQTLFLIFFFLFLWGLNYITFYLGYERAIGKINDLFYNIFNFKIFNFNLESSPQQVPYYSSSLLLASLKNPVVLAGFVLNNVFIFLNYKYLYWKNFESSRKLKYFIFIVAFVLAWAYSTYDYNLYLDQAHYFDRFFLLFSAGLILVHPAFAAIFVPAFLLVISQFNYPLIHFSINDKYLPTNMLLAFMAFMHLVILTRLLHAKYGGLVNSVEVGQKKIIRAILSAFPVSLIEGKIKCKTYVFLIICICASFYFNPGVKKLWISPNFYEWSFINELYLHAIWKLDMGWLAFLDESAKQQFVEWLKFLNTPMMLATVALEIGALFILFRKKIAILFILSFAALHLGIFIESGILFWKWIWVNLALVVFLLALEKKPYEVIFNGKYFVFSILIIFFSEIYFRPVPLGWWDTRNYFKLQTEGIGESGKSYRIQDSFMDPFHVLFEFQRFEYIIDEKLIYSTGGTTKYDQFIAVKNSGIAGLPALKEKIGKNNYDEEKAKQFDEFIQTYFHNLNKRKSKDIVFSYFPAPHHVYFDDFFHDPPGVYKLQEPIKLIRIRFREYHYEDDKAHLLQDKIIRKIPIP